MPGRRRCRQEPLQLARLPPCQLGSLRIVSYNMLAPSLLQQNAQLYAHCHPAALLPAHRIPLLAAQIEALNADVIGLQEIEDFDRWEPHFAALGYQSIFKRRTGTQHDGVALLWRCSRLQLCDKQACPRQEY